MSDTQDDPLLGLFILQSTASVESTKAEQLSNIRRVNSRSVHASAAAHLRANSSFRMIGVD